MNVQHIQYLEHCYMHIYRESIWKTMVMETIYCFCVMLYFESLLIYYSTISCSFGPALKIRGHIKHYVPLSPLMQACVYHVLKHLQEQSRSMYQVQT